MNACLIVLKQAILEKRSVAYMMGVWLIGGAAMTLAVWPECHDPLDSEAGVVRRMPTLFLVTIGMAVWAALRRSVDAQLSPAAVQLVPGLRRAAVVVTMGSWLAMGAGLALEVCVYGVSFPLILAPLLVCMAFTVSRRSSWRYCAVFLPLLLFVPIRGYHFPQPGGPPSASWIAGIALLFAIATGATFIVTQLGKRAEAHASSHAMARGAPRGQRQSMRLLAWDGILQGPTVFQWAFDRILRAPSPKARLFHGLGPIFHWSHAVLGASIQAALTCMFMFVTSRVVFALDSRLDFSTDAFLSTSSLVTFFYAILLAETRMRELCARRKEQALFAVLPGAPTGRDVNRWLMQTLFLQHAVAVASSLWFVLVVGLALGLPLALALKMVAAPLAISLLTAPVLLRDYASMKPPWRLQYLLIAALVMFPLSFVVRFRGAIDSIILVGAALVVSGAVTGWRYARSADGPAAFPVGRLAA